MPSAHPAERLGDNRRCPEIGDSRPEEGDVAVKFGVAHGNAPASRSLEIMRAAEEAKFDQFWMFDSHVIWQECYSVLGWLIGVSRSETMEFGTLVTNPISRDATVTASAFATLAEISGDRVICGIGRGDSVVRVMKRKPAKLADVEHAVNLIRTLTSGGKVDLEGVEVEMDWARAKVPIYIAGYGPRALTLAGRLADGVVFQIADPFFIEWGLQFVRQGASEAGRDPAEIVIHCSAATFVSDDMDEAREQTRWFPALVGNHVADVLRHHDAQELPQALFDYVHDRPTYDYRQHGHQGAEHSKYVPDAICDRFCVLGTEEQCEAKLRELAGLGVSEFNIYPYIPNLLETIDLYGRRIAPRINAEVTARR
jgi:probable F420-dependent oxidoreductase